MVGVLRPEDVRDPGGRGEPLAPEIIKELMCNFFKPSCTSTHKNQNKHTIEIKSVACAAKRLKGKNSSEDINNRWLLCFPFTSTASHQGAWSLKPFNKNKSFFFKTTTTIIKAKRTISTTNTNTNECLHLRLKSVSAHRKIRSQH